MNSNRTCLALFVLRILKVPNSLVLLNIIAGLPKSRSLGLHGYSILYSSASNLWVRCVKLATLNLDGPQSRFWKIFALVVQSLHITKQKPASFHRRKGQRQGSLLCAPGSGKSTSISILLILYKREKYVSIPDVHRNVVTTAAVSQESS